MSYMFFSLYVLVFLLFSKRNNCFFLESTKEHLCTLQNWRKQTKLPETSFFVKHNGQFLLNRKTEKRKLLGKFLQRNEPLFLEKKKNEQESINRKKEEQVSYNNEGTYLKEREENVKVADGKVLEVGEVDIDTEGDKNEDENIIKGSEQLLKGEHTDKEFCDILSQSFLSYANFLILNRCLCDYRDGLKKVQRRIIWSMLEINKGNKTGVYKKCARIVGEVIGKYHPHGDKSVYDALVRLAQKHHNNNLLIKGYGNFGTVEFNAAAMRYTEAKLSDFCFDVLLDEVNDENIDYVNNFDGNEKEPKVFCSKIPLLLINGCSGIAVSVLSSIPCHNLIDVINSTISFLINPNITEEELFHIIRGPDFPTGGIIITKKSVLQNLYKNGKGNVIVRSTVFLEYMKNGKIHTIHVNDLLSLNPLDLEKGNKKLIIRNLPPNVKPNELILNLIELLNEKKNEHENILSKIRDESEKDEMRIVLELKKHAQIEQIHNILLFLFKYTQMEINYHCNFVCTGYQNSYTRFSLKSFLNLWCEHRIEFIKKNYQIKNSHLLKELNIIKLYLIIQKRIVDIISYFQKEPDLEKIKRYLKENFQLNEEQIKYILSMKIQKLINIKNVDFEKVKEKIMDQMKQNDEIINSREKIKKVMIEEMLYIKNKYGIRKVNMNVPPPSVKYEYVYLNKEKPIQPQWLDMTSTQLKKIENGNLVIRQKEMESEVKSEMEAHSEEGSKTEKQKKRVDYSKEYRNTYIDAVEKDEREIYSKEEMLILLTEGGYVKKIKITEKLNNHLNNIIKLTNVKYILKENEDNHGSGRNSVNRRGNESGDGYEDRDASGDLYKDIDKDSYGEMKRSIQERQSIEVKENEEDFNVHRIGARNIERDEKKEDDNKWSKFPNIKDEKKNIYKIKKSIFVKNNDKLLITDNRSKAFLLNVSDIPICSYDSKGVAINQFIKSTKNITGLIKFDENTKYLAVCSESGKLKIIRNDMFLKKLRKGVTLFKNKNKNGNNIYFSYCNHSDNCIVGTKNGLVIQFPLSNFKISKKNSTGNKCITLSKNDKVVDLVTYENTEKNLKNMKIIFVSKNGLGKMISVEELKVQKKKGKGYRIMRFKKKGSSRKSKQTLSNEETEGNKKELIKEEDKKKEKTSEKKKTGIVNMNTNEENEKNEQNMSDELLSFKLYDASKKKENDLLIMITDYAVLIRKNVSLLKKKNRNQSSHIYAKLNKLNKLIYFDIM